MLPDGFRKIHLADADSFLACTVATTVLEPNVRVLHDLAELVRRNGFPWAVVNRGRDKSADWWPVVEHIESRFEWGKLLDGDPITAIVHKGTLEFGSRKVDGKDFGGGCHRAVALAIAVLSGHVVYQPFDILLDCR